MLASVRTLALSRMAAALVAFALSGAPALAAASTRTQTCVCPHHGRDECKCHSRRGATATAKAARILKPCHQDRNGRPDGDHSSPVSSCSPRIGGCGTPDPQATPPRYVDAFTFAELPAIAVPDVSERMHVAAAIPSDVLLLPDTPPPRDA